MPVEQMDAQKHLQLESTNMQMRMRILLYGKPGLRIWTWLAVMFYGTATLHQHVFNTSSDFQENSAVLNFTFWAVLKLMIHLKLHILRWFRPSRICIFQYVVFLVVRQSTHRSRSISISLCMITPECALGCFFLVKVGASAVWCWGSDYAGE